MSQIATLLHISDLHFVEDITQSGKQLGQKSSTLLVNTHAFSRVEKLALQISDYLLQGNKIDLLIATGDLSTDGAEGSLKTTRKFFESEYIYYDSPRRIATRGLGFSSNQTIVIPGNHDRYDGNYLPIQKTPVFFGRKKFSASEENEDQQAFERIYHDGLKGNPAYPFVVGYRRNDSPESNSPAILFFVYDSTILGTGGPSTLNRIANGSVSNTECQWMIETVQKLSREKQVASLSGKMMPIEYENCIRIVLIHHHPIINSAFEKSLKDKMGYTQMENAEAFLEKCFVAGMDMILFGHKHAVNFNQLIQVPAHLENQKTILKTNLHPIQAFCCPSTTESHSKNGFYIFDIDDNRVYKTTYLWESDDRSFKVTSRDDVTPPRILIRAVAP